MLVLAEYAGLFTFPVVSALTKNPWWMLLVLVGMVTTVFIHEWMLLPFTQKIANREDPELDERQTAVRDNAHRTAYQILGTAVIVALVLLQMLTTGPLSEKAWTSQILLQSIVIPASTTILWMYVSLPTAVIAWREPDPETDE